MKKKLSSYLGALAAGAALLAVTACGGSAAATPADESSTITVEHAPGSTANVPVNTKFGSVKEPDFEAVSAGDPDLVIISGCTAGAYEELSKIAPTIDLFIDAANPMDSFKDQAQKLGTIVDKSAEVEEQLAAVDATVSETKAKAVNGGKGLIVLTLGGEAISFEYIKQANPDILYVIDPDPMGWYVIGYGLNNVKAMVDAVAGSVA